MKPVKATVQALWYSTKKGWHSFTKIIGVSACGRILSMSPSYPGSANDNTIMRETFEVLLSDAKDWEWAAADKGFRNVHERILTPPKDQKLANDFSSIRITVENTNAKIKKWAICRDRFRVAPTVKNQQQLLEQHHRYYMIVAALVNIKYHGSS